MFKVFSNGELYGKFNDILRAVNFARKTYENGNSIVQVFYTDFAIFQIWNGSESYRNLDRLLNERIDAEIEKMQRPGVFVCNNNF